MPNKLVRLTLRPCFAYGGVSFAEWGHGHGGTDRGDRGRPLNGSVKIPAAKNSVLPLFAASLLCTGEVRLQAVPRLADVEHCMALLRGVGCAARWEGSDAVLSGPPANSTLPGQTAGQMRASILFCAPLLARLAAPRPACPRLPHRARPIDLHLQGLQNGGGGAEAGEGGWC